MDVAVEGVGAEVGQVEPGVAAVQALVHAVNLDAGPDGAAVAGVNDDVGGAGVPMGQSMLTPMSSLSQDLPPSRERKPSGRVPAKRVSGLAGSMATDQTWRSPVGLSTLSHDQAVVVAAEQAEAVGAGEDAVVVARVCCQGADVALGEGMGLRILVQVSPLSELMFSPCPTVPTKME